MAIEPKEWAEGDLYPAARMTELEAEVGSSAPSGHQHEAMDISDSSAFSRGLIRTQDAAGARAHLQAAAASDIPDVSNLATKDEIPEVPDVSGKADKSEIPDVSGLASQSALDELAARVTALESGSGGGE
ncbi:hypothetical protein [Corynebacterium sp.]|uniref:hypothetical protein n=1 Tax=Corynebacterium sp. TaxID=1720 RepID=UPI0028AC0D87|nr:hypothetical protein [Corynebacterium sp.]